MNRADLFAALRPFAPDGEIPPADVVVIDLLSDRWGYPRVTSVRALKDSAAFFAAVRGIFGTLEQPQVDGINVLLKAMGAAGWASSWAAYAFATVYHETAKTMQPVHERGGNSYLRDMYDIEGKRPDKARELGNLAPGDGVKFAGRGYVQLTGRRNYIRLANALGVGLLGDPDLAMKPDVAARILATGMEQGLFSGKKMADYFTGERASAKEFENARRIINGTDRADLIAGYAQRWQAALTVGGWA